MFPPYKSRSAPAPSRSRGRVLRCTKPRPQWPAPYRLVIYRRTIRKSAAVKFKFYLKARSSPAPLSESNLLVSREIQSQRSEALSVIEQHYSARKGLALLPEMVAQLHKLRETNDYASINVLLASVNSLFIKFRDTINTTNYDLFVDLKYCLDNFAKPLFELFKQTASLIDHTVDSGAAAANVPILIPYLESQRLCCSIFHSLNFRELSEFFKDHISEWMVEFNKYIKLRVPALEDGLALAELRAAVCENLSLYVIKEEELFHGYVIGFAVDVSNLLISSSSHGREQLSVTVSAIKFLTAVSKSSHHVLLSKDVILHLIYKRILIPHLILHDVDEELFEINPVEFIRKDMEGSDIDPIRRIACELLKGIATHYKDKVVKVLFLETARCFDRFYGDPKGNWKHIYCAFCLAISLATENAASGISVSTDILNVEHFFFDFIFKELEIKHLDVTSFPMIQAVSLKFIILFRNKLSTFNELLVLLLPYVTRLLTSPHFVVHSYAAWCIEELFLVEDDSDWFRFYSFRVLWLAKAGYTLSTLMSNLFGALNFPESEENLYVMKCITRVVLVGGDLSADVASLCIEGLTSILHKVCKNPKNALFNHYLFESLTRLIRRVCFLSKEVNERPWKEEISVASLLERKLYPCLQNILARDIREFFTYAFRLLAELVDLNRPLLPAEYYSQVFDILHLPDTWMSQANVPAKHELNFPSVIYSKLVSSSAIKDQGYYVMNTVIENLGFEVISPFVSHIWVSLFNRLQNQRTVKSVKNIIVFMSLFMLKDGPNNIVSSVNTAVQPNAFQAILEHFWIPNLKLITDPIELKLAIVASTRLICESPDIFDMRLWGKMLASIITLVSRTVDYEPETMGVYNAVTFTPLEDPLKGIKDPRQFLVVSLFNLCAASSQGRKCTPQVISGSLERANQRALLQLFNLYNVCTV